MCRSCAEQDKSPTGSKNHWLYSQFQKRSVWEKTREISDLYTDVSTVTGERFICLTRNENLEDRLKKDLYFDMLKKSRCSSSD